VRKRLSVALSLIAAAAFGVMVKGHFDKTHPNPTVLDVMSNGADWALAVFSVFLVWHLVRAPWLLDEKRKLEIKMLELRRTVLVGGLADFEKSGQMVVLADEACALAESLAGIVHEAVAEQAVGSDEAVKGIEYPLAALPMMRKDWLWWHKRLNEFHHSYNDHRARCYKILSPDFGQTLLDHKLPNGLTRGSFEALLDQHQNELLGNAEALKRPYSQELSRLPDTEPQKPSTL